MRPSVIYKVAVRLGAEGSAIITAFSVYNHLKFEYFLIEDTFFNERLGSLSYFVTMLSFTRCVSSCDSRAKLTCLGLTAGDGGLINSPYYSQRSRSSMKIF